MRPKWMFWWWVVIPGRFNAPFIKFDYSRTRLPARHLTAYDRNNGWKVGRVHARRIFMEAPPR